MGMSKARSEYLDALPVTISITIDHWMSGEGGA